MAEFRGMAVAWLRKEDWPRWLEIDSNFQPNYGHWRHRMDTAIARLQAQGTPCIRITVDPDTFLRWCEANRKVPGSDARALYASLKAAEADEQEKRP